MTLRYGSLFSGIEAVSVAWEPLGMTPAFFAEIDPFCCELLSHYYPSVPNLGDVNAGDFVERAKACGEIDILVGGTPCFVADTLVLTDEGLTPIQDVRVGELVLTHKGRWRKVLSVGSKFSSTITLKGQGHIGLTTTPEHPFWSMAYRLAWDNPRRMYARKFDEPQWCEAGKMAGKMWAMPTEMEELPVPPVVPEGRDKSCPPFTNVFWFAVGSYLGNGWTRVGKTKGCVIWGCVGEKRDYLAAQLRAAGFHVQIHKGKTCDRVVVSSRAFAKWLAKHFGKYADGKTIPSFALAMNREWRGSLLEGYLAADGTPSQNGFKVNTVSYRLSTSAKVLAVGLGYSVTTTIVQPRKGPCIIEGRAVNEKPYYQLGLSQTTRFAIRKNNHYFATVKSLKESLIQQEVYNLEVEEDNSYTADGIVVHNCQSWSVAGKRQGFSDPRGNLTLRFFQIAKELGPTWVAWENVPGVLTLDGGRPFGAILGEVARQWAGGAWRTLDAKYWGVSQRRRRVFLVANTRDESAPYKVLFEPEVQGRLSQESGQTQPQSTPHAQGGSGGVEAPHAFYTTAGGHSSDFGPLCPSLKVGSGLDIASPPGVVIPRVFHATGYGKYIEGVGTMRQRDYKDASTAMVVSESPSKKYIVRRITPLEAERLQAFPDNYTLIKRAKRGRIKKNILDEVCAHLGELLGRFVSHEEAMYFASDSARYKALGNSMCVNLMRWLGQRILLVNGESI